VIATVNGARMYYEVHGSGRAVVFIHDRAGSLEVWRAQVPALAATRRVVLFDSRGTGRSYSGPLEGGCTTELLADDVVALLDLLGIEEATLVGLSMGGGVAQMCALRHRERVAALVLVSTSPRFSESTRARMRGEADRIEVAGIRPEEARTMTARWFSPAFAEAHPEAVAAVCAGVLAYAPDVLAARSRANAERDFTARLPEITCPVLFVAGADDPMGPSTHANTYQLGLHDLEVRLIEGSSHLVPVEAADEFNRLLADFVSRKG
jgi:pimeloyl-ACP methyl ester carboxylesterase